jgi:hypothetical protein
MQYIELSTMSRAVTLRPHEEYAEYQIALDRLNDKDDEILTGKELRACFGD